MRARKTQACRVDEALTMRSNAARLTERREIGGAHRDTSQLIMRSIAGQSASRSRMYIHNTKCISPVALRRQRKSCNCSVSQMPVRAVAVSRQFRSLLVFGGLHVA